MVGVINADTGLHFPDFRAAERSFQLVTQVAGRTGRGESGGRVVVQTFSPDHRAIETAVRHEYLKFATEEWAARQRFGYPPASRLIRVIVRGDDDERTQAAAQTISDFIKQDLKATQSSARILGPAPAPFAKLRGKYRFHFLVLGSKLQEIRQAVGAAQEKLTMPDDIHWVPDVDPQDLL